MLAGVSESDAQVVEDLAAGRAIVPISRARSMIDGVIGVRVEDGNITALSARRCGLQELPDELAGLAQLRWLDVSSNTLRWLPAGLAELGALEELYVDDNRLVELARTPRLRVLDASNNPALGAVAVGDGLEFLYVAHCGLDALPALPATLRYLNADDNRLASVSVPDGVVELRLARNRLGALPHAPGARELHLRGNFLRELSPALGTLRRLEHLVLRDNTISVLPDEVAALAELRHLDVRTNLLGTIPPAVADLARLRKLDARWNPLRGPTAWADALRARGCLVYA